MTSENRHISAWIIPRWAIIQFTNEVGMFDEIYVAEVLPHDTLNYLVITYGKNDEVMLYLTNFIADLFTGKME